jgi:multidrug efflux pump subunit AcrA (membrane-fusion protein)
VVGRRLGNLVEIKQGLKSGERVIGNIAEEIRPGSKVSVKKQ